MRQEIKATKRLEKHALVIVGGGVGGMAAAIAAYDAGCRDIVLLETDERLGGVLPPVYSCRIWPENV